MLFQSSGGQKWLKMAQNGGFRPLSEKVFIQSSSYLLCTLIGWLFRNDLFLGNAGQISALYWPKRLGQNPARRCMQHWASCGLLWYIIAPPKRRCGHCFFQDIACLSLLWKIPCYARTWLYQPDVGSTDLSHKFCGWGLAAFIRWWPPSTMRAGPLICLWPPPGMSE